MREARVSPISGTVLVLFAPHLSRASFEVVLTETLGVKDGAPISACKPRESTLPVAKVARDAIKTVLRREPANRREVLSDVAPKTSTSRSVLGFLSHVTSTVHAKAGRAPAEPSIQEAAPTSLHSPPWHAWSLKEVCAHADVADELGISNELAERRLLDEGKNALVPPPRRSEVEIFMGQLGSMPVAMLAGSGVLSIATGGLADAAAILAVVGINAAIGYITESSAERTIASLSHSPQPTVVVRRSGKNLEIPIEHVVRGDLIVLLAGVFVAADARIVEAEELTVDESSLTGESVPVSKTHARTQDAEVPLAERVSMVYRGTLVTGGSGLALVVATGARTELGHIQTLTSNVQTTKTPMQLQLGQLGGQIATVATLACAATLGVGLLRGERLVPMLRTAVSLAVAAVPEGLPTVAITTLALGLSRMRTQNVLVRQLAAVETLGAVQVVCVDKTGTLTINRMTVTAVQAGLELHEVRGGQLVDATRRKARGLSRDMQRLMQVAVLCSEVDVSGERGQWVLKGSPTESALVQLALDCGVDVLALRSEHPLLRMRRRAEKRSYMATLHQRGDDTFHAVKGRPSEVLELCNAYLKDGVRVPMTDVERATIEDDNERLGGRALRVLGLAYREHTLEDDDAEPEDLVWVGLIGMQDPPRDGVADVIARFRRAGVRTVMITGDQSATAQAVGKEISLSNNGHLEIIDSTRLDQIEPDVLTALAQRADVFARVSPAHKLQIVTAMQRAGLVVAMTGDGVNDSPALRAADIGIAMGGGGTSVAREVADLVLEDDELSSLVDAIEQGRTIYDDIRKAVHFILATNLGEILYTFTCVAGGLGEPLSPMQLLWINLLTDVFPELALAVQPPENDVLARPPRDPKQPMFDKRDMMRIGTEGTVITLGALSAYLWARGQSGPGAHAGTMGFTALTLAQLLHAWSSRSETHTIFDREALTQNKWLPLAIGGTVLLQIGGNLIPGVRTVLGTVKLGPRDWLVASAAAIVPFLVNEWIKLKFPRDGLHGSAPHSAPVLRLLPAPAE